MHRSIEEEKRVAEIVAVIEKIRSAKVNYRL
jgi:hypothetical protein